MRRVIASLVDLTVLLAVIVGTAQASDFSVGKDIPYGEHPKQKLDIYSPEIIATDTPVLIFFHGGAWSNGSKDSLAEHGKSFSKAGMFFVAANYRLRPEAIFPSFAEDAAAATAFALTTLRTDLGELRPVFVSGWSAGAYNAAMVAYDESLLEKHGIQRGTVTGLIGLSGPYEGGLCAGVRCSSIFPEELRAEWHIANHVDDGDPPMLLFAAEKDPYVPARHHEDLALAANLVGIEARVIVLPSRSHFATLGAILKQDGQARTIIDEFVAEITKR